MRRFYGIRHTGSQVYLSTEDMQKLSLKLARKRSLIPDTYGFNIYMLTFPNSLSRYVFHTASLLMLTKRGIILLHSLFVLFGIGGQLH